MQRMNQSDFLPETKTRYPYFLLSMQDENTPGIISCLPKGEDIPVCINHFGDIVCLTTMNLDIHALQFLLTHVSLQIVTQDGPTDTTDDLFEFLKIYNKIKGGN